MGKGSQRDLVTKSLLALVLKTFKVENRKKWPFYQVKVKTSKFKEPMKILDSNLLENDILYFQAYIAKVGDFL